MTADPTPVDIEASGGVEPEVLAELARFLRIHREDFDGGERLSSHPDGTVDEYLAWCLVALGGHLSADRVRVLEAALREAREALTKYGRHEDGCYHIAWKRITPKAENVGCDCGLHAAIDAVLHPGEDR